MSNNTTTARSGRLRRVLTRIGLGLLGLLLVFLGWVRCTFGGYGEPFEDRSGPPQIPASQVEVVATLDEPPGNIAVSADGRVFLTVHPESRPETTKFAELIDGELEPYPSAALQAELFETVLGVAIDRQQRVWTIDHGNHGLGQPRLLAFDLATNTEVHRYDFTSRHAGAGSFFNDLQVSPDGRYIYIADISVFGRHPALVIYDTHERIAWRRLEQHASVQAEPWRIRHPDKDMVFFWGLLALRPAVDSIALDKQGQWLYYGAMTHGTMFRVPAAILHDPSIDEPAVRAAVEAFGDKPLSDGLSVDEHGTVYITDVEHRGIMTLDASGTLSTLIADPRIRWADGLSFGPDGWLYVSDSAIPDIMLQSKGHITDAAPYHVFRFKPGPMGIPGQ
ncbi:MAG: hypothetical protein K0V04_17415 [Deltaproteobacteria bacterium]|nr:hypothetical protein [Deltaproteobacteria bacterium]